MGHCRCGQRHGIDSKIGEYIAEFRAEPDVLVIALTDDFNGSLRVAESLQRAEFMKIPNEVLAPVANAHNGYPDLRPLDWSAVHVKPFQRDLSAPFLTQSDRHTYRPRLRLRTRTAANRVERMNAPR